VNAPDRAGLAPPQTGRAVPRLEDDRFLTGTARFTDDVRFEGMLHAAILRSPHARARLSRVDLARVRAMPGVALAVSGRELSGRLSSIPMRLAALPGLERFLQKPIAVDEVRYVGEPVALVVAQSRYLAEDALELIEVDYEPQPPVTTMAEALADRHLVHADAGTNVAARYEVSRGNPQAAFARAPYTRKVQLRCHRHTGAPLETRGLVAESLSGRLWIWGATKVPFFNRRVLAAMLGLDEKSIDMIETDIGGGFGIRGEFYPEDFLIPWASVQIGRPVKWIEDRREHLLAANHARESECELEIAMSLQGEILGLRGRAMADLGAYVRTGGGVAIARTGQYLPGPYRIADYACEVIALVTDKTPVGTYRGPGRYEANFFRERLLDIACADLGLDPVAVREANLIRPEEMPYPIGRLVPIEAESAYERGDYRSGFRQALAALDYPTRPRDGALIDGLRHGVGVACFTESSGGGRSESARIRARSDGRFEIYSGVATMGQGHETVFAQIAADELHCPVDAFTVFHGSTTGVEEGWGTFHSRAVVVGGSAVKRTAEKLRESLLRRLHKSKQSASRQLPRFVLKWEHLLPSSHPRLSEKRWMTRFVNLALSTAS
jgi:carbon-monoxide dehydrogenase large subunit